MSDISDAVSALNESTQEMRESKESFEAIRGDCNDAINSLNTNFSEKVASLTITATDGYRKSVEDASGGRNTVIYDAQGNPNIMVVIPRFNCEDLGLDALNLGTGTHPAFKTNGVDRGEILVGKYLASQGENGGCAVVGGVQPKTSVDYDDAKLLCSQKGEGWHLMSAHEWAAIALWSLANGTVPRGNSNNGRSHEKKWETGLRIDKGTPGDSSGSPASITGSGPVSWSHDHGEFGVQDLVGNVWEWLDQFKISEGQIICTEDNDPYASDESWTQHDAYFDSESTEASSFAGSPILSNQVINRNGTLGDNSLGGFTQNTLISSVSKSASYIENELLRRLLVDCASGTSLTGAIWVRNYGERFLRRGGNYHEVDNAGLGAALLNTGRDSYSSSVGFRPAYFI